MVKIKSVDEKAKIIYFDDNTSINHKDFLERFMSFFQGRVAGETLMPIDIEQFMRRTSSKTLSLLMKNKKMEGYLEGSMSQMLSKGQKIAIATIVTIIMIALIVFVVLKNQGMIPGM